MLWLILAAAAALIVYLLVRASQRYEQESASAALEQVERLVELTQSLEERIQNLEAIVTAVESDKPGVNTQSIEEPASARPRVRS